MAKRRTLPSHKMTKHKPGADAPPAGPSNAPITAGLSNARNAMPAPSIPQRRKTSKFPGM